MSNISWPRIRTLLWGLALAAGSALIYWAI